MSKGTRGEQGFQLQSAFNGGAFADLAYLGANVTGYQSPANPPNGSYQFRVRSYAGGLASPFSASASLTAGAAAPSASIAWIQPAEDSWGPAGTLLTGAGCAHNGTGNVELVWRERRR